MSDLDVKFTDEIPKINREGLKRDSKYRPLLDAVVENEGKVAKMTFESQGKASSRASSLKTAAEKHPASADGEFTIATRSGEGEDEFFVYVQYSSEVEEDEETETKPKAKKKARRKAA